MKILWLTIDRSQKVANIFGPLQAEAAKVPGIDIEFIARSDWTRRTVMGQNPAIIDPGTANRFDVVFTDAPFAYMEEAWNKITVPKALLMEDQHGPQVEQYIGKAFDDFGFGIFFVRYRDSTQRLWERLYRRRVFWLPHSIDPETFKDYGLERKVGLLSIGQCQGPVYPVRRRVLEECANEPFFYSVKRPIEKNGPNWPAGKDYARLLNRAKTVASCTSIFGYPIMKTIEIPACGSVLFSDFIPEMADLGFKSGKNFLQIPEGGNIAAYVRAALDSGKLPKIARSGFELVHKRHTAKVRAREFIAALEGAI